jgi:hypothetical protein
MLQKKQDENPNPTTIADLVAFYVTPLEDIVKHFESLFLASVIEENLENDTSSVANLGIKVKKREKRKSIYSITNIFLSQEKDEAKNDILAAISPYLDKFFQLAYDFIDLPVS